MSWKGRDTNVSVSVLSKTNKQQIDSFVVMPPNSYVLGPDH